MREEEEEKEEKLLQYQYTKMMSLFIPLTLGGLEMEPRESLTMDRTCTTELHTLETH